MSNDNRWSTFKRNVDIFAFSWEANVSGRKYNEDAYAVFKHPANDVEFEISICPDVLGICLLPISSNFKHRYMFKIYIPALNIREESNTYIPPSTGFIDVDFSPLDDEDCRIDCYIIMEKAFKVSNCNLIDDLGALVNAEKFSDVTIETAGGHKIPAHKNILSARSNVFAAMFSHDMMETQMNCVTIDDFSQEVVMEMLRYMYTGTAPKINEVDEDLLVAADKYQLDKLKEMCFESLNDNLCIENAARVLKLADVYEETELVLSCVQFIKKHAESVAKTPNWKSLWETDKELIIKKFDNPKALIPKDDEDLKVTKK